MNPVTRTSSGRRSLAISAALLLAACGETDRALTAPADGTAGPSLAKAAPATSTPLAVTVADGGTYKIQSDGLGEYVNGVQGMQAEIDGSGNLQITPNNLNAITAPRRTLRFDYTAPVSPLNTYRPNESGQWNFKIKTNRTNNGNPRIQDLALNASGCYNTTIAHSTTITSFQDDFNLATFPQGTYVYITRTSATTWSMVSNGSCLLNANAAGLQSQDRVAKNAPLIFRGYYDQQLSISFRAI